MSPALRPSLSQILVNIRLPNFLKGHGRRFMSLFALDQISVNTSDLHHQKCPLFFRFLQRFHLRIPLYPCSKSQIELVFE